MDCKPSNEMTKKKFSKEDFDGIEKRFGRPYRELLEDLQRKEEEKEMNKHMWVGPVAKFDSGMEIEYEK